MRPEDASSRWRGLPDPEDAAPLAITAYFRAYGPTTIDAFGNWLAGGWFGKRQLRAWFVDVEPSLAEVDVEGERAYVLADDVDELASIEPTHGAAAVARLRPVRPRPGHRGQPRRPGVATRRGEPAGGLDLAGRPRRWSRLRHVGAGR